VHARSTTVQARPESIDAGVAYVRDEAMPTLLDTAGCTGLSMLVHRTSGRCIVTSAWQTEEAMRDGDERLWPLHHRVGEILGGVPEVEDWEIAVLHRDHTSQAGACVRVVWVRIEPEQADSAADVYRMELLPEIQEFEGFCSASFMVDRTSGYAVSSVTFDGHDAMRRTRRLAAVVRARGIGQEASGEILEVDEFELALAHLQVPEMA
jgi:hypothetical protein